MFRRHIFQRFVRDQSGATAIEYALLAALVAIGAIGGMGTLGNSVSESFVSTGTRVSKEVKAFADAKG